jgi:hypothetical protein
VLQVSDQTSAGDELPDSHIIRDTVPASDHPIVHIAPPYRHTRAEGWLGTRAAAPCGPGMESNIVADTVEDVRAPLDVPLTDRRSPGRRDYQNAHLIALLRSRSLTVDPAEVDVAPRAQSVDDPAPARAVVVGVSIGTAMWAVIIIAVRYTM